MIEIGRICMKIAGRDAGNIAVVVDSIDKTFVLVDGNVRRKRCNIKHLEPTEKKLKIKAKAQTKNVLLALEKAGFKLREKNPRKKTKAEIKPKKTAKKTKVAKKPVKKKAVKKIAKKTKKIKK